MLPVLPAIESQAQLGALRKPGTKQSPSAANMRFIKLAFLILSLLSLSLVVIAQAQRGTQRPGEQKTAKPAQPQSDLPASDQDVETVKIDTNLVTVPVIASSRTGSYIADLKKEEFKVSEDGVAQQVAFFATVNAPFHVVLMLDTSASTEEKLGQIQQAAIAFVELLGPKDKVKVISFDNDVRDLNEFTSDKTVLRGVIKQTRSGTGTRLYDAVQLSLNALRPINQRRAIVLFTDGVDFHSDSATFEATIRDLDESGVIVYPIRFDTRAETERLARKQEAETNGVQLPTIDVIRQPPVGTTPRTFPSDEKFPTPTGQRRSTLPLPDPSVIFGRRQGNPAPTPDPNSPIDPFPDNNKTRRPDPTYPGPSSRPTENKRSDDSLRAMLDQLYLMADSYLRDLADRSGGQVYRADNVGALPQAFAAIAAELRTQYLLGYYPSNPERDGSYRKISVKTTRKDIAIRARPGYRARTIN
jgi:Mg-chelatase subunit ChlD